MSTKTFYVTTPIYYPSGDLHIGHVYTTTLADVLYRYKKDQRYDVFFMTGSDEHGQKIETKAKEAGITPKQYVDGFAEKFKNLWKLLDIGYSKFIRTTDGFHEKTVQKIFSILLEKDLVYLDKYVGTYCISCEEFLTASQISDGICITCKNKPTITEEETYMLRISRFKDFLKELIKSDFLIPQSRRNEMLNSFIDNNLEDLSVSRISFKWGIPVLENKNHVLYVWIDALSNYITGLGYLQDDDKNFKKFWNKNTEIVHFVGKEITRFHSIYWPVILKSLDLRMPTKLISHGWILSNGMKMSKSIGNIVDPIHLINKFGSDTVRFFVANNLPYDSDGDITDEAVTESFNLNLANNIGNLLSRSSNMIISDFSGKLDPINLDNSNLFKEAVKIYQEYKTLMEQYNISEAVKKSLELGNLCNKYIEDTKPWELKKENKLNEVNNFLYELQYTISLICFMLKPILVKSYKKMVNQIGLDEDFSIKDTLDMKLKFNAIKEKFIIFKRIK